MKSNNTMTDYSIVKAEESDLDIICQLFEEAILFQKMNNYIGWNNYDRAYLQADIQNGLLFKIVSDEGIICVFSICYSDELIWRDMENGNAIYLHRIVLNRRFKGEKVFKKVLGWALSHAGEQQLHYVRMDTWASNEKIINYYKSYGFAFIENYTTPDTDDLPVQHRNLNVALLEFQLQNEYVSFNLEKVSIEKEFSTIDKYWTQKIIGIVNGQLVKLAKGIGEINWHKHDDQDELFILHKGHLTIQLRGKNIELFKDDMFIVPKGMEHCPKANGEAEFLIMGLNITSNAAGGRPEDL
jgi:mannose-6-phosphate isomerase-like protein (cupin superfamily)